MRLSVRAVTRPSRVHEAGGDLRAADVDADGRALGPRCRVQQGSTRGPGRCAPLAEGRAHVAVHRGQPGPCGRGVDPEPQHDERDPRLAAGRRQRGVDVVAVVPGGRGDRGARAGAQLRVLGPEPDHEVAVDVTQPDHRQGRELVEDELLRGAGGQPGGALDDLGPDRDDDSEVGLRSIGDPVAHTSAAQAAPRRRPSASAASV